MKKTLRCALAGAAALALAPSAAQAADPVTCEGTVANQVVGDVVIPYQASCELRNVIVEGSVTAQNDAESLTLTRTLVEGTLRAVSGNTLSVRQSAVQGNVSISSARGEVVFSRSLVRGNLLVNNAFAGVRIGDARAQSALPGNVIVGNLTVARSHLDSAIGRNAVNGNVLVAFNTAPVDISRNVLGGTLGCNDNEPAPVLANNLVATATGQCAPV